MSSINKDTANELIKELLRLNLHGEAKNFLFGFYEGMENAVKMAEEEAAPQSTVIIEEIEEPHAIQKKHGKPATVLPDRNMDGQAKEEVPGRNMVDQEKGQTSSRNTNGQTMEAGPTARPTETEENMEILGWPNLLKEVKECLQGSRDHEQQERTLLTHFKSKYMSNPGNRPDEAKLLKNLVRERLTELDMLAEHRRNLASKKRAEEEEKRRLDEAVQEARQRRLLLEEAAQAKEEEARRSRAELQQARVQELFAEREQQQREAKRAYHHQHDEIPRCYVCGTPGVKKSKKCPNWDTHTQYPERTYKK